MSGLEEIVENLKTLPSPTLEQVAHYVEQLKTVESSKRKSILADCRGSLTDSEADEMASIIESGCENIDNASC